MIMRSALVAALVMSASLAFADAQPGDRITRANAETVKDLVSPGLMWCIIDPFAL